MVPDSTGSLSHPLLQPTARAASAAAARIRRFRDQPAVEFGPAAARRFARLPMKEPRRMLAPRKAMSSDGKSAEVPLELTMPHSPSWNKPAQACVQRLPVAVP